MQSRIELGLVLPLGGGASFDSHPSSATADVRSLLPSNTLASANPSPCRLRPFASLNVIFHNSSHFLIVYLLAAVLATMLVPYVTEKLKHKS